MAGFSCIMKAYYDNKKGNVPDNSDKEGAECDGVDWLCWGACKDWVVLSSVL